MPDIVIDIDYREWTSGVIEALQQRDGVFINRVCLESGDYKINRHWLVERKTLTDLAASIIDGRLFRQLARQCWPYRKLLLIEGSARMLSRSGIRRESIQGALITIGLCFGIPIVRSLDADETAALLVMIGRQWGNFKGVQEPYDTGSPPRRSKNPERKKLHMLTCLPGIGVRKARALLHRFGSIEAVLLSTVEELAQIRGIGRKTAQEIRRMIRGC